MSQQKAHSLIKCKKSTRRTIYCWQLIRLNPSSGQGQHLHPATFREPIRALEPLQGLPVSPAQIAGAGVVGVYYLCSPFKTSPTKEQSFPSAGNVGSSSIWRSLALSAKEWASRLREGTACSHLLSATSSLGAECQP